MPQPPARPVTCVLYEQDGTLLTAATCYGSTAEHPAELLVGALEQPGRVLQRCILDDVYEVCLQLAGRPPVPARVTHLFCDPDLGRTCTVQLSGA